MQRLPKEAKETNAFTALHCWNFERRGQPLVFYSADWQKLTSRYVKDMCLVAGIESKKPSNLSEHWAHLECIGRRSLKRLFNLGADMDIEALHTYERVSSDQERSMCSVLAVVTNQLLPAGQAVFSAGMSQLNSAFNVSGYTVTIYSAPVSIGESSTLTNGNYHLSVKYTRLCPQVASSHNRLMGRGIFLTSARSYSNALILALMTTLLMCVCMCIHFTLCM